MSSSKDHSSSSKSKSSSSKHKEHSSKSSKDHSDHNRDNKQKTEHQSKGFLCKPAFHNTLPTAPSGPFFRPLGLYKDKSEMVQYATYQVSSLEKSCIWQPHYGPELGLRLDLADQESILPSDINNGKNIIDPNEMRYLSESRVRVNKRNYDEQPWWLRHTTSSFSTDISVKDLTRMKKNDANTYTDEIVNIFDVKEIEKTFIDVEKKVITLSLPSKRVKTDHDIEWSIPLLPDKNNATGIFSLMNFEENPTALVDSNSSNSNKQIGRRIDECIIANYRPTEKRGSFIASLILPNDNDNDNINSESNSIKYNHVSDFNMSVKKKETGVDDFMIVINNNAPDLASITPLSATVEMKKITQVKNEEGVIEKVYDYFVSRR